jgi:hypothetical protein
MQLPIVIQKELTTFLYEALPLCIILAHSNIQDWFLGHYLNISSAVCKYRTCKNGAAYQSIRMQYLEGGIYFEPHKNREVLEYHPIRVEPIINNIGLINFFKESLESGFGGDLPSIKEKEKGKAESGWGDKKKKEELYLEVKCRFMWDVEERGQ